MRYTVTNRVDGTFTGLILGAAADLDVDSISSANDGLADSASHWVGAQGGWSDTSGFFPQANYAALFYIPLDSGCSDLAVGGQVLDNVDYIYPEEGYNTDSLYDVMARTSGWNATTIHADTASDVNVVMVDRQGATLGPDDTLRFALGFAVSDISKADLTAVIEGLRSALNPACGDCPIVKTGDVDVNGSITASDIIFAVNYVFKGGPAPNPCAAAGDVNCDGSVTASDVIYLVNHVFKGGPEPCDVCDLIPGTWSCP